MARQSISFTDPNDAWLNRQVESKEYTSKSELVNDLIRRERQRQEQTERLRSKLEEAERSGFTNHDKYEILTQSKEKLNG